LIKVKAAAQVRGHAQGFCDAGSRAAQGGLLMSRLKTPTTRWALRAMLAGCLVLSGTLQAQEPGALIIVLARDYDVDKLQSYSAALPPIYARFGGTYQVLTRTVRELEGRFAYDSVVISQWASLEYAEAFWNSPEYTAARTLREGNGSFDVFAVPTLAALSARTPHDGLDQNLPDLSLADEVASLLEGRFSSAAQAQRDTDYDVVESELVRIWPERRDGVWLYQEQAALGAAGAETAERKQQPYFQRIVQLVPDGDDRVVRHTWEIRDPAGLVGAWREPARFAGLGNDILGEASCPLALRKVSPTLWFSSFTQPCPNSWRGASTLRSQGVLNADGFTNWDRGFDADGRHVWGPASGGYEFRRMARN